MNQGQLSKINFPWFLPAYFKACKEGNGGDDDDGQEMITSGR